MNAADLVNDPLVRVARELTPSSILAAARSHENARSQDDEDRLLKAGGFAVPDLMLTSFQHHAAVLAYNAGIVGFEQTERTFLDMPDAWRRHDVTDAELRLVRQGVFLKAGTMVWPFRQDAPMANHSAFHSPRWLTHAFVHALLGSIYWPGLTEFELVHMARLSEVVAAWHWYWLAELGRETCSRHVNFDGVSVMAECHACSELESQARSRDVRLERLGASHAAEVASSAVDTLRYEVHAYWHGLLSGRLVIPEVDAIDHGDACDYARIHQRRLTSAAHALWVDQCLEAGTDYAADAADYARRTADLVEALMTPAALVSHEEHAVRRAVRTLQDLAQRVAHDGQSDNHVAPGHVAAVEALGALVRQIRTLEPTEQGAGLADRAVADGIERVAADIHGHRAIFQLGYRPTMDTTVEPEASRAARREAYLTKIDASRTPWAPFMRSTFFNAVDMTMDGPRQVPLSEELNNGVRAAVHLKTMNPEALLVSELLYGISVHWGGDSGAREDAMRWHNRLSPLSLPPRDRWDEFRVMPNPNIGGFPSAVPPAWLQKVIDGTHAGDDAFDVTKPPMLEEEERAHVLAGHGRTAPLMLPYTRARAELLEALQYSPTLNELEALGHDEALLERSLREELVVLMHSVHATDLAGLPALPEALVEMITPGIFDEGPWADPEQAAYYTALVDRSEHYSAVAKALVGKVRIHVEAQVADLGCGTGVVAAEVLKRLGPEGLVVGVDPAEPMLEIARARFEDGRVKFERGNAHSLNDAMPLGPGFSAVLCSSALWLEKSPESALRAIRGSLRRRGQVAFSVPAEYLGDVEHMTTDGAVAVATAIHQARKELGLAAPSTESAVGAGMPEVLSTQPLIERTLERIGYGSIAFDVFERDWTVAEYLDWMGQPVVVGNMVPGASADQRAAFLKAIAAKVPGDTPLKARWTLITARRA